MQLRVPASCGLPRRSPGLVAILSNGLQNGPLDHGADKIHIIQHCLEIILGLAPQLTAPGIMQTVELNNPVSVPCPGIRKAVSVREGAPEEPSKAMARRNLAPFGSSVSTICFQARGCAIEAI